MAVDLEACTVPHYKAPINSRLDLLRGHGGADIIMFYIVSCFISAAAAQGGTDPSSYCICTKHRNLLDFHMI